MAKEPRWARRSSPTDSNEPFIPILSPEAGKTVQAVILSEEVEGLDMHYVTKRTRPCNGDPLSCPWCQELVPVKWKGYLGVWLPATRKYALAEITPNAHKLCPRLHKGAGSLRGLVLVLERERGKPNGKVTAKVLESRAIKPADLPPCFDVVRSLEVVFDAPSKAVREKTAPPVLPDQVEENLFPIPTEEELARFKRSLAASERGEE